jgi:cytochrome d ubiquinol oxidase subunit II
METLWFIIIALMLAAYVILDGFDIGAGIIHLIVGKTDQERRLVLRSIGPVWDGNEVWLLAAGGALYMAFPMLYASSFSGFYLPLMCVLWLLMLRALGIEFRMHLDNPVWRGFFDAVFSISSILLAIFFGAALGNVVRGVPLDKTGYFFNPLWTNWRVGPHPGILDWYTVLAGLVALATLTQHGALYLALKTEGDLHRRARRVAAFAWPAVLLLTVLSLIATMAIQPLTDDNFRRFPLAMLIPVVVFGSLVAVLYFRTHYKDRAAFVSSGVYIAFMLIGAAFGLYPNVLPASTNSAYNLTIFNTRTSDYAMSVALVWWAIGMVLAIAYFVFIYRMFRGKVRLEEEYGHGD